MQWLQKKFKTVQHRSVFFSVGRYRLCVHCHQGRRILSCQHWRPGKWLRQFVLKPSYKVSQNSELAFLYWCDVIYECSFTTVSFFPFIIQYFLLELFFSWGGGVYSLLSRHVWICCLKKTFKGVESGWINFQICVTSYWSSPEGGGKIKFFGITFQFAILFIY